MGLKARFDGIREEQVVHPGQGAGWADPTDRHPAKERARQSHTEIRRVSLVSDVRDQLLPTWWRSFPFLCGGRKRKEAVEVPSQLTGGLATGAHQQAPGLRNFLGQDGILDLVGNTHLALQPPSGLQFDIEVLGFQHHTQPVNQAQQPSLPR
jgi:hypothetical protein